MIWRENLRDRRFKTEFLITIVSLALILFILANFLNFIETRDGVVFKDPVLNLFEPVDLTWLIFGLIYISIITALIAFSKNPVLLLTGFQCYTLLIIFRIIAMYLVPLDPPLKMIPLTDPFVEFFGTGQLLTKDLFFSGHTATLFLFFLLTDKKPLKILFFTAAILVAASVLLQHVHYSIDVFAAPFFTYCSFIIAKKIRKKFSSLVI